MTEKRFSDMTDEELLQAVPQWYACDEEATKAFREQIVPQLDAGEDFYFDGDATCNDGDGKCKWNGIDRRCNCDNRRVSWSYDHGFWRAEAY